MTRKLSGPGVTLRAMAGSRAGLTAPASMELPRRATHLPPDLASPDRAPFRVLALDGGGVRGVCTAAYLAQLESRLGAPLYRWFDLICGTSTGGIIALALALGHPAGDVLELYRDRARSLFVRRHPWLPRGVAMAVDALYRSEALHAELRRVFGDETVLGEAKTRVGVPAVNVTTGQVTVFKTRHLPKLERDHLLPAWQVAAATAAAPVYFDPFYIEGRGCFADGGLWANTPTTVGIVEAIELGHTLDSVEVLSIGTGAGRFHRAVAPVGGRRWRRGGHHGLLGWGTDVVSLAMHAQTGRAENVMRLLLGSDRHTRIQFDLPEGAFDLDAVDKVSVLTDLALEKAQETARAVHERFLREEASPFTPVPLNR